MRVKDLKMVFVEVISGTESLGMNRHFVLKMKDLKIVFAEVFRHNLNTSLN